MGVKIGHASINEYGKVSGGNRGDQNKKEVCIRSWYAKRWDFLLRPIDPILANKMASACEAGCLNDNIGYSQAVRNTLHDEAKKVNYDLSKIKTPCDCDCSSFMTICAIAGGAKDLEYTGNAPTTGTMVTRFTNTGLFELYTAREYLDSDAFLKRGDILVRPGYHTVMVLNDGLGVLSCKTIKMKAKGAEVLRLQKRLTELGYDLEIDGDFGPKTLNAVKDFQGKHDLVIDGIVGPKTWWALGVV